MKRPFVSIAIPVYDAWFMDTELLILAEKFGYRIFDLPVRWVDDPDSRVRIWSTVVEDIKGLMRVRRTLPAKDGQRRVA